MIHDLHRLVKKYFVFDSESTCSAKRSVSKTVQRQELDTAFRMKAFLPYSSVKNVNFDHDVHAVL